MTIAFLSSYIVEFTQRQLIYSLWLNACKISKKTLQRYKNIVQLSFSGIHPQFLIFHNLTNHLRYYSYISGTSATITHGRARADTHTHAHGLTEMFSVNVNTPLPSGCVQFCFSDPEIVSFSTKMHSQVIFLFVENLVWSDQADCTAGWREISFFSRFSFSIQMVSNVPTKPGFHRFPITIASKLCRISINSF